jgi:hypothetical protein
LSASRSRCGCSRIADHFPAKPNISALQDEAWVCGGWRVDWFARARILTVYFGKRALDGERGPRRAFHQWRDDDDDDGEDVPEMKPLLPEGTVS